MYCIARQCVLPARSHEQAELLLTEAALHSLTELFEAVPDPRGAHGLRYDLPFLLTCLVAALLCNCDGTEAVAQWCHDHLALLRRVFGRRLFLTPSGSLYRWLLPQLDARAIERVLGSWVQATTTAQPDEPLALDGKTLRGARSGEQTAPHLLAFCTHHSQETFWQVRVDEKTNEIPVAKQVLPTLPIQQRVCTADALHTHAEFIRLIHELQAETVLTVKGNQPMLYADLATYFADPQAHYLEAQTMDRRRGRTEVRTIKVSTEMNAYLAPCWPYVAQVAQLTRTVTKAGKTTTEVVYLITTLPPTKASPQRLLELVRGHWSIENRLHYVRDVSFREDRSRLRTGHAPQILAAMRNLVIALIHRSGSSQVAATRQHFASCPKARSCLTPFPQRGAAIIHKPWAQTGSQPVPLTLATLATDIFCLDETRLDAVGRYLKPLRALSAHDSACFAGKLVGLLDLRAQRWLRLEWREAVHENCRVDILDFLRGLSEGSLLLFDLGYFSFSFLDTLTQWKLWWVCRYREKTSYHIVHVFYRQRECLMPLYAWEPAMSKRATSFGWYGWAMGSEYACISPIYVIHSCSRWEMWPNCMHEASILKWLFACSKSIWECRIGGVASRS